jgi:cell division protein FtsW
MQPNETTATKTPLPGIKLGNYLLFVTLLLTAIGLVAIFASSSLKGAQQFNDGFIFLRKHAVSACIGLTILGVIQWIPFRYIERMTLPAMLFVIGLLLLVFVPGAYSKVGGAYRWLNVPFIGGQPAELVKLVLVLFFAKNLSRSTSDTTTIKGLSSNVLIFALFAALLLVQKDLGTPAIVFFVMFSMLFVAGIPRKLIAAGVMAFVSLVTIAVWLEPYRMKRLFTFLDPWAQVQGSGFQIIQSFLAFQNGGLLGSGLGESKQKLFFLPEAHCDFILAVIAEELGFVGVTLIALCFAYFCYIGFKITAIQTSPYRRFLAYGLTMTITAQALFNMAVVMGLLPTKGITLPFISSGNSSLLVFLLFSAILTKLGNEADSGDGDVQRA